MNTFFKKVVMLCPVVLLCIKSHAQNVTGTWQGNLNIRGTQIPIIFHIAKDSTNKLKASFDSPSQRAFNLRCSEVITKDDSITLMMAMINGKYAGQLSKDGKQIAGSWFQGGGSVPLIVDKTSETATVKEQKRPQRQSRHIPIIRRMLNTLMQIKV
jgi:hypothetical protein